MLNINTDELKLLLKDRKNKIERPKYNGISEIISSISISITLFLADFSQITIIKPLYFKIIAWFISIFILIYGIFLLVSSIVNFYSVDDLYNEIIDLDPTIEHPFNIILIKNSQKSGKYLVFKSKRWNCWLFPNYHCKTPFVPESEILHIKDYLQRDLNAKGIISAKYIGNELSIKMSVPNKLTKKYNFHYFIITEISIPAKKNRAFYYNGKKYNWKTIDHMYKNRNILKKNKDVLDYVRKNCELS